MTSRRIQWARKLQSLAQTGMHYTDSVFDRERYEKVREIAAEMMAVNAADADADEMQRVFAAEAGPSTPKVVVRGAAIRGGRILMVREIFDGKWSLPGGWADVCESPAEAVAREVFEETGFRVRVESLYHVRDQQRRHQTPCPYHIYDLFFLCEILGGEATCSTETTDVGFFDPDDLPDLSLSRVTEADIVRAFRARSEPDRQAEFD